MSVYVLKAIENNKCRNGNDTGGNYFPSLGHGSLPLFHFRGQTTSSGGAAGGTVWVTADDLLLSGEVKVDGGGGCSTCGGGGGGMIALHYRTGGVGGTVTAYGGSGHEKGAAGIVYTKQQGTYAFRKVSNSVEKEYSLSLESWVLPQL